MKSAGLRALIYMPSIVLLVFAGLVAIGVEDMAVVVVFLIVLSIAFVLEEIVRFRNGH